MGAWMAFAMFLGVCVFLLLGYPVAGIVAAGAFVVTFIAQRQWGGT